MPTRSTGTAPYRATRVSPDEPDDAAGEQVGEDRERDQARTGVGKTWSRYCGPQVNAAVSTM